VFVAALMLRMVSSATPASGNGPTVVLSRFNVHLLFAAVAVVAAKFVNDRVYPMSFYARCLRLNRQDLCQLEAAVLGLLHYDLAMNIDEFNATSRLLMQHA